MNRKHLRTTLVSLLCATSLTFAGAGAAQASVQHAASASVSAEEEVTEAQIGELAAYLEAIYEGEFTNPDKTFNHAAAAAKFGTEFADATQAQYDEARASHSGSKSGRALAAKKDSYATCLLKGVGLGGLAGASAAIVDKLKKKQWSDAARLITKEAVKRGIKIGVKGGVAGLAAALGAYAVWCATPWS